MTCSHGAWTMLMFLVYIVLVLDFTDSKLSNDENIIRKEQERQLIVSSV